MTLDDDDDSWPATSIELIERSISGDADAWNQFTAIYGPIVYAWVRRWGVSADEASDVMQEIFIIVFRRLAQFSEERGRFRGWLHRLARNVTTDYYRSRKRHPYAEGGTTALERQHAIPDPHALEAIAAEIDATDTSPDLMRRALEVLRGRFKEQTWTAAWRVIVERQDPAIVAAQLNLTVSAVYTAKSRVLACLRAELRAIEGQE